MTPATEPLYVKSRSFGELKARILKLTKGSLINLQVAKDKAKIPMIATVEDCQAVLKVLEKPRKIAPPVPGWVKDRYVAAHDLWFRKEFPETVKDHGVPAQVFPKIYTSNGLTRFCLNFITWQEFRATRVSTTGRLLGDKWIKGTTRAGSADISATINGRSVMIEIKVGADKPSDKQLAEQYRERKSGGVYEFVHTAAEFLQLFDQIVYG